jgi:hypothetical protein
VTGDLSDLSPQKIQDQILNEKGQQSGAFTSLNKITSIKCKGNKADKGKVKCFYCQKLGHKSPECCKKKKDTKEKEKKEKGNKVQSSKSVNAHITTISIEEIDDNEDLSVSLYAASQS